MTTGTATRAPAAATSAMLLAVVLTWLNGIVVRTVTVHVPFFGDSASQGDYRVAAGAGLLTALLVALGLVALHVLGVAPWLEYVAAAGAATQLAIGLTAWWSSRGVAVDDGVVVTASVWDGAKDALELPGCWLLLVLLVVAVERTVRRARRSE